MKKIVALFAAAAAAFTMTACGPNSKLENDGTTGIAKFEHVKDMAGCGIELMEGDNRVTVTLNEGELHMVIKNGDLTLIEKDFKDSETVTVNAPKAGLYIMELTGKDASGIIDYINK